MRFAQSRITAFILIAFRNQGVNDLKVNEVRLKRPK